MREPWTKMTKTRATKAAQEKKGKKDEQDLTWPGSPTHLLLTRSHLARSRCNDDRLGVSSARTRPAIMICDLPDFENLCHR